MTPKSKKKQKSHDFPKVDVWFFFLFVCLFLMFVQDSFCFVKFGNHVFWLDHCCRVSQG